MMVWRPGMTEKLPLSQVEVAAVDYIWIAG
jgi:hypothetical protein